MTSDEIKSELSVDYNDLVEYLLRADISAKMVKNNHFININWASEYYLNN